MLCFLSCTIHNIGDTHEYVCIESIQIAAKFLENKHTCCTCRRDILKWRSILLQWDEQTDVIIVFLGLMFSAYLRLHPENWTCCMLYQFQSYFHISGGEDLHMQIWHDNYFIYIFFCRQETHCLFMWKKCFFFLRFCSQVFLWKYSLTRYCILCQGLYVRVKLNQLYVL